MKINPETGRPFPLSVIAAAGIAAAATIGAGALSANAAGSAANTQAGAARAGTAIQQGEFANIMGMLAPFRDNGATASTVLRALLGFDQPSGSSSAAINTPEWLAGSQLLKPFNPTQAELEQTPGYQFTLSQGLKGVQNAATSMGLGKSGSALAGAADYASGLASQTFQQQFQNYWAQKQNIFNMLTNQASLGENAAAQAGNTGAGVTNSITNLLTGGANAQAAGQVGVANALGGAVSSTGNSLSSAFFLNQLMQQQNQGKTGSLDTVG